MRRGLGVVLALLLVAGALYLFLNSKSPVPSTRAAALTQNPSASQTEGSPTASPPSVPSASSADTESRTPDSVPSPNQPRPASLADKAGRVIPDSSPVPDLPPATVLENVRRAVRQYGDMFGGNPVGTNPEITSQLTGNNPKHINFINAQAGMRIGGDGELVDPWGTPFFFHQISAAEMEIHSAGPDKIMWTPDDLVAK